MIEINETQKQWIDAEIQRIEKISPYTGLTSDEFCDYLYTHLQERKVVVEEDAQKEIDELKTEKTKKELITEIQEIEAEYSVSITNTTKEELLEYLDKLKEKTKEKTKK
jgi:hypothetical protein